LKELKAAQEQHESRGMYSKQTALPPMSYNVAMLRVQCAKPYQNEDIQSIERNLAVLQQAG